MAFIPVPGVVLAELVFNQLGSITENTLYFHSAEGWDVDGMVDLAEQLKNWWTTRLRPGVPNSISLTAVKVTDLSSQNAPGIIDVNGLPLAGQSVSEALPNNVTAAISFVTALRGRSYRGRNYVIGMVDAMISGNTINPANVTLFQNAYAALATDIISNAAVHVVVSRYNNNAPRVTGVATPVTGYTMENVVDSQRRRLPKRGA